MIVFKILFWASITAIIYTYLGYPVVLFLLSSISQVIRDLRFILTRADRRRTLGKADGWPAVTLIIAAYNEEDIIDAKIKNSLELDYPRDKLEIIVASDGSTDATNDIAASHSEHGVKLVNYTDRRGKASVVNRTVPQATHDIVVLSDANTMYEPQAIQNLVKCFSGDDVGVVVGEMIFESPNQEHKGEVYYWRYEVILKLMENKLGAILGANGGFYAIRKNLFEPVPDSTIIDDFVIPLRIAEKGYRQVYSPEARATEETAANVGAELVRRKRIAAGNFQSIFLLWRLLNPFRGYIAFTFVSHKIMRWCAPFFMIVAFVSNILLLAVSLSYAVPFGLQVLFYGSAWLGWRSGNRLFRKLCAMQYYFVSMNIGMLQGFFNLVRGTQKVTWEKNQR